MNTLIIIPARGGSKGIPGKNIKLLDGKPLITYTIDVARSITSDDNICVSTDDHDIIKVTEDYGLKVPFVRPQELATDSANPYYVHLHAIQYYEQQGRFFESIMVLQPTSPFRTIVQAREALELYHSGVDMVASVVQTRSNPYFVLFEEDEDGFLRKSKQGDFTSRQESPKVYELNGAIYIINIDSLKKKQINKFERVIKYEMEEESSLDLDTPLDWKFCEFYLKHLKDIQ